MHGSQVLAPYSKYCWCCEATCPLRQQRTAHPSSSGCPSVSQVTAEKSGSSAPGRLVGGTGCLSGVEAAAPEAAPGAARRAAGKTGGVLEATHGECGVDGGVARPDVPIDVTSDSESSRIPLLLKR